MIRKMFIFILIGSCFSQQALALGLTISELHLNSMMKLKFPITQTYMEYTLEASRPALALYAETQSVAITARIDVTNKHNRLLADATFKGKIMFDKATNSLKISDPLITKFAVIDNTFPQSETSINSIKETVGKHLPIAVLIDFNQISNNLFQFTPSSLTIVEEGLRVEY